MSKLRQDNGDDYPEAAKKHLKDSKVLMIAECYDGAAYLAGYVVECTFKTMIQLEIGNVKHIHDLSGLSTNVLYLAKTPGIRTARYAPKEPLSETLCSFINGWKVTMRYQPDGSVPPANAQEWLSEAETVYNSIIVPMRLDGVI